MSEDLKTQISNGAILLIGSGIGGVAYLDSYDSDTSELADWFRRRYDVCRKRTLLRWRWNEAILLLAGTDAGGDIVAAVHPGYTYAYTIPASDGCIGLRGIVDEEGTALPYRVVGTQLHCDYTTDEFWWDFINDIETGFSPGLQRCIEYELAIDLCGYAVKGQQGDAKRTALETEYRELILPCAKSENQDQEYDAHNSERDELWHEIL